MIGIEAAGGGGGVSESVNVDFKISSNLDNNNVHQEDNKIKVKLNKIPVIKKAKLLPNSDFKKLKQPVNLAPPSDKNRKIWNETKIYFLPLIPSDEEEKNLFMDKEYRCCYCDDLCDEENLECKVCSKVSHVVCLYKRGHLDSLNVPLKIEWTCADCSDLSKCLTDEEMRKIINLFDKLDYKKECIVTLEDYMAVKRKIYEEDGEPMTPEQEKEELRRFKLMDSDNSGTITWNEFIDFETGNLLAIKNKVELSNHLTIKELIVAKRKFLSYDKEKMKMISKEDAKSCYKEYVKKLKDKLGLPFVEHISHCMELLGFKNDHDQNKNSAKTMWLEFVRKMTILLLFDRLNSSEFRPKYCKQGPWYLNAASRELNKTPDEIKIQPDEHKSEKLETQSKFGFTKFQPNLSRLSYVRQKLCMDEDENVEAEPDVSFRISQLMSKNIELDTYRPYNGSDFGSYNYVIRSRHLNMNSDLDNNTLLFSEDEDDENNKFNDHLKKTSPRNQKPDFNNFTNNIKRRQTNQLKSISFNFGSERPKKIMTLSKNRINFSRNLRNESVNTWQDGLTNLNTNLNNREKNNFDDLISSNQSELGKHDKNIQIINSTTDFNYSKVTNDIYKNFGKIRRSFNYPQHINHPSNKVKSNRIDGIQENADGVNGSNESLSFNLNITNLPMPSTSLSNKKNLLKKEKFNLTTTTTSLGNQLLTHRSNDFNNNIVDKQFMHLNKDTNNLSLLNQYATSTHPANVSISTSSLIIKNNAKLQANKQYLNLFNEF